MAVTCPPDLLPGSPVSTTSIRAGMLPAQAERVPQLRNMELNLSSVVTGHKAASVGLLSAWRPRPGPAWTLPSPAVPWGLSIRTGAPAEEDRR